MTGIPAPRESLDEILALGPAGDQTFEVRLENFFGEALPGDVLARMALAAGLDCAGRELCAIAATFLRRAPPSQALALQVERLADDARISRRAVRLGGEKPLCQAVASFATPAEGAEWSDPLGDPPPPDPDRLPSTREAARSEGWPEDYARGPIEFRRVGPRWPDPAAVDAHRHVEWVRLRAALPQVPRLHAAALVFLCGFYTHWEYERRFGRAFAYERYAPLALSVFVHHAPPWDDWLLLRGRSDVGRAGWALSHREIYTREGRLLASSVQEARLQDA